MAKIPRTRFLHLLVLWSNTYSGYVFSPNWINPGYCPGFNFNQSINQSINQSFNANWQTATRQSEWVHNFTVLKITIT